MNNDFLKYIKSRGFLHQCTNQDGIEEILKKTTSGYIGFDCTSDSPCWIITSTHAFKDVSKIWS